VLIHNALVGFTSERIYFIMILANHLTILLFSEKLILLKQFLFICPTFPKVGLFFYLNFRDLLFSNKNLLEFNAQ